jgi:hypothetical protein
LRDVTYDEDDLRPRRGRAVDERFDDEPRPSLWRRVLLRNIGDTIAVGLAAFIAIGIGVNALMRQSGPHPAPLFATTMIQPAAAATPVPAARPAEMQTASITPRAGEPVLASVAQAPARPRAEIVADIQRELTRRRLYDGAIDGMTGPKTSEAVRRYETQAGLRATGEANEAVLVHMRRPAQRGQQAPRPQGAAAAPARPEPPQTITQLLDRDGRPQQPAPRPSQPAPPAGPQSIADILADGQRPAPRSR